MKRALIALLVACGAHEPQEPDECFYVCPAYAAPVQHGYNPNPHDGEMPEWCGCGCRHADWTEVHFLFPYWKGKQAEVEQIYLQYCPNH